MIEEPPVLAECREGKADTPPRGFCHILEGCLEFITWLHTVLDHLKFRTCVISTATLKGGNRPEEGKWLDQELRLETEMCRWAPGSCPSTLFLLLHIVFPK